MDGLVDYEAIQAWAAEAVNRSSPPLTPHAPDGYSTPHPLNVEISSFSHPVNLPQRADFHSTTGTGRPFRPRLSSRSSQTSTVIGSISGVSSTSKSPDETFSDYGFEEPRNWDREVEALYQLKLSMRPVSGQAGYSFIQLGKVIGLMVMIFNEETREYTKEWVLIHLSLQKYQQKWGSVPAFERKSKWISQQCVSCISLLKESLVMWILTHKVDFTENMGDSEVKSPQELTELVQEYSKVEVSEQKLASLRGEIETALSTLFKLVTANNISLTAPGRGPTSSTASTSSLGDAIRNPT